MTTKDDNGILYLGLAGLGLLLFTRRSVGAGTYGAPIGDGGGSGLAEAALNGPSGIALQGTNIPTPRGVPIVPFTAPSGFTGQGYVTASGAPSFSTGALSLAGALRDTGSTPQTFAKVGPQAKVGSGYLVADSGAEVNRAPLPKNLAQPVGHTRSFVKPPPSPAFNTTLRSGRLVGR